MKILVSEDDPVMMMVVSRMLENLNHEVIKSVDGKEALEIITAQSPDMVITDIMLPIFSGIEIVSFCKKLPKKIPVILLSAMPVNSMKNSDAYYGADGYFMKPVTVEQLENKIEELMKIGNA